MDYDRLVGDGLPQLRLVLALEAEVVDLVPAPVERGADELGVLELPVLPTHSVDDIGEMLCTQMAEQLGVEDQLFKLHFTDAEGDSVLVSTHTEIEDLVNCSSLTVRLEKE